MMKNVSHIEIEGGTVIADGNCSLPTFIGQYRYYVSVIEGDGGRICMWDGDDYADALMEADELKTSFSARRVVDMTVMAA
ncbi:hypothetical protein [Rhizobium alvei]|uniref:DUF4242 domain-containing protein n=1 Tax=Rhizobium alvei TaxID=1132659 RepID=A0ABT8YTC6_9HYPH|nr:hypothetical protein [Rhizobium alvei]MDO6966994.1 hypothetical protein [Rhizobium alvei]